MYLLMDSLGQHALMIAFGLVLFGLVFLRLCSSRYFWSINVLSEFLLFFSGFCLVSCLLGIVSCICVSWFTVGLAHLNMFTRLAMG